MYERLTKRDSYGHAYTNETIYDRGMTSEDGVHYEKHYFENGTSAYDGKPIDRLCDIEDKIEQGKILELPCAVGQIVYEVQPMRARTQGYKITTGKWNGHYWWFTWVVKDRNGIYGNVDGFSSHQIGKTVFLDRASAEAKLREMEGDNDEQR